MNEAERINREIQSKGFAFANSMLTDQERFYDSRAIGYDKQMERRERIERRKKIYALYHASLRKIIGGMEISYLDFGCGTGEATLEFIEGLKKYCKIKEGMAIDISSEMVGLATGNLKNFKVEKGTAADVICGRKFDLITAFFHVLCHMDDKELGKFFQNTGKSMKKGGCMCFDVMKNFEVGEHGYSKIDKKEGRNYAAYYSLGKDGDIIKDEQGNPLIGTDRLFTRAEIAKNAKSAGLKVVKISKLRIKNPDPKVGYIQEYVIILSK